MLVRLRAGAVSARSEYSISVSPIRIEIAIAQLHRGGKPGSVDHGPVGAAEVGYPKHVAAFTHLGMQPRSERVLDTQVVAGRAAYRYSRSVQIDYGITARRRGSDNQTWHRANETERVRATGRQRDEEWEEVTYLFSYSPHSAFPVSVSLITLNCPEFCLQPI